MDNNLKIALCFSGDIRCINQTKEFWMSLIQKYNIDVYGSFWDNENIKIGDSFDNFNKLYNPKKIEIESYKNFENSTLVYLKHGITPPTNLKHFLINSAKNFGFFSMWYKIWRANLLTKESESNYDVIIRARTDVSFENLIIQQNNFLNVPQGKTRIIYENSEGVSDLFAYGRPDIMDYYSTCVFNIVDHINKGFYMAPNEYFLRTHLDRVEMNIRFMPLTVIVSRCLNEITNEVFCYSNQMKEEILPSNSISATPLTPNKKIKWKSEKKLKFS